MSRQPFLHDLTCTLHAPIQAWSRRDGGMDPDGIAGIYCGDTRVARDVAVTVDGVDVEWIATTEGPASTRFEYVLRVDFPGADPVATLVRERTAAADGVRETLTLRSAEGPLDLTLTLRITPDAAHMNLIKGGVADPTVPEVNGAAWTWHAGAGNAELIGDGQSAADTVGMHWQVAVPSNGHAQATWGLRLDDTSLPFVAATAEPLSQPVVEGSASLRRLVERSISDLNSLRLAERDDASHCFLAAGAPWFLTLFGRDSLISARLLLPLDAHLALGTLRTLAGRQGRAIDVGRAEAPGKILHEVRAEALDLLEGTVLPPEYYGTIDATPLWITLLHRVWRSGVQDAEIVGLMDALVAALGWLADHSDPDGDGFLEYHDESGHGLANQGWKDSGDSIRFADGTIAEGPIALAEVQGYAHAAALAGADLLEAFGRTAEERAQADWWRQWGSALADRFRAAFWVSDDLGPYPVIALDRTKQPVTGVASNMGHLLGTGILNEEESAAIVARLLDPTMFSGYGVRTMSNTNGASWPYRYHVGSVWTHDTAVIIDGMLDEGFTDEARVLASGLLYAAEGFDFRLPELFGGQDAATQFPPAPYPASCRPQAWAAASGVAVARALGGLDR